MTDKRTHNNSWAERLNDVQIPGADESWVVMNAKLDREQPPDVNRGRRRWLLLVILLLLLIGVCNCPGRYHREKKEPVEKSMRGKKDELVAQRQRERKQLERKPVEPEQVERKQAEPERHTGEGRDDDVKIRAGRKEGVARKEQERREDLPARKELEGRKNLVGPKEREERKDLPVPKAQEARKERGGKTPEGKTNPAMKKGLADKRVPQNGHARPGVSKEFADEKRSHLRRDPADKTATGIKKKAAGQEQSRLDRDRADKTTPGVKNNAGNTKTPEVSGNAGNKKGAGDKKSAEEKKIKDLKKGPEGNKTPETDSTVRGFTAGLGVNQFFTIGGQEQSKYNSGGTTGGLSDYIPVPVIRYYFNPKLFVQVEAQFNTPQYTKKGVVVSQPPLDTLSPVQYHQSSVQVNKLFYFNVPLSIHYSPYPNFYIGTGLQFSRLSNGIALFEDKSFSPGSADTLLSAKTQSFKGDSIYRRIKTREFRLLLDLTYHYKKFVLGLRYNRALTNYLNIRISATQISQSRNSSLQLYLRYFFWDNRKKRK